MDRTAGLRGWLRSGLGLQTGLRSPRPFTNIGESAKIRAGEVGQAQKRRAGSVRTEEKGTQHLGRLVRWTEASQRAQVKKRWARMPTLALDKAGSEMVTHEQRVEFLKKVAVAPGGFMKMLGQAIRPATAGASTALPIARRVQTLFKHHPKSTVGAAVGAGFLGARVGGNVLGRKDKNMSILKL